MTLAAVNLWGRRIGAVSLAEGADVATFAYEPAFVRSQIEVAPLFMPHLQASKFVNSPKLALLLTEIECAAQGWLVDAEAQTAGEVREDFSLLGLPNQIGLALSKL